MEPVPYAASFSVKFSISKAAANRITGDFVSATIRDVARRANVGIATVSRVLNNNPAVSEETRNKVLAVIEELDYLPNPNAQRLSRGRTHSIAVTLPFLTYPSFVERLRGVQHALFDSGYDLVLYSVVNPARRDDLFAGLSRKSRTDGILIISIPLIRAHIERFLKTQVPVVLVDIFHPELNRVFVDDFAGGKMATQHLIELGHRKIGFISDLLDTPFEFLAMRERYGGYCQALEEAGIPFNDRYHQHGPHGREEARQMAKEMLALPDPPTAIFAGSDTQAIGILDAAREMGVQVPRDLSLIGYDGIRDAEYLNLTTIEQPLYNSGVEGVNLLLSLIEAPAKEPQELRLPLRLVVRGTTTAPN